MILLRLSTPMLVSLWDRLVQTWLKIEDTTTFFDRIQNRGEIVIREDNIGCIFSHV
jgi:hypothetical protein